MIYLAYIRVLIIFKFYITDQAASPNCNNKKLVIKQSVVRCDEKLIANVLLTTHSMSQATLQHNHKVMISG